MLLGCLSVIAGRGEGARLTRLHDLAGGGSARSIGKSIWHFEFSRIPAVDGETFDPLAVALCCFLPVRPALLYVSRYSAVFGPR